MEKPVSASHANRQFSQLLRAVRQGDSSIVTSYGKAVARIVPVERKGGLTRAARMALFKRLRSERVVKVGHWSRDELYENER